MAKKQITQQKQEVITQYKSIRDALIRELEGGAITYGDFARACLYEATNGNPAYARLVLEYVEGKPKDILEVSGQMPIIQGPLQIEIIRPGEKIED
jgi:hypothetical protein